LKGALLGFALAALMAVSLSAWASHVRAETPTPSASPTVTPYPQSTVTVHFVTPLSTGGTSPVLSTLVGPVSKVLANGVDCTPPHDTDPVTVSGYSIQWPLRGAGLSDACVKGPPTTLRFEFLRSGYSPPYPTQAFIVAEGEWIGGNLDIVREFFVELFPSTSPSVSATPVITTTPAVLPRGGGLPVEGRSPTALGTLVVGMLVLSATAAATILIGRKRPTSS
jgi:hypothetical protein